MSRFGGELTEDADMLESGRNISEVDDSCDVRPSSAGVALRVLSLDSVARCTVYLSTGTADSKVSFKPLTLKNSDVNPLHPVK
mmetsp:Transcript_43746/g.91596  ORF Transcript_43746/g.91596 Transcript_43746/m.91596 type:complete len:83 (+) Transcript_43746:786-1034(+)